MKVTSLVCALLWCLYALTAGGGGYSVDGTFSYEVARSLATDPSREFLARNRDTLTRWGPVVPALGVPFAWLGARLGEQAPRRDTVPMDGRAVRLYDWPAIGAPLSGAPPELRLPLTTVMPAVARLHLVSFLSFSTALEDGTPVAEVLLYGEAGGDTPLARSMLRAGRETAEWAYDLPLAERPRHRPARLAGYWPGNPEGNLYAATVALEAIATPQAAVGAAREVVFRYVAPAGRLHVRSALVELVPGAGEGVQAGGERVGAAGRLEALEGPASWSDAAQAALFSRLGFSFLNGPLMALTAALFIPLAGLLGYRRRVAVLLALGYGVGTLAWPYAKYDFAEPGAGALALGATALVFAAAPRHGGAAPRKALVPLATAGGLAALAAGARYTAAWFIPLLAVQIALLWLCPARSDRRPGPAETPAAGPPPLSRQLREGLCPVAAFLALPLLAGAGVLLVTGRAPALWSGWRQGLASGWLDFSVWEGLYGLLLSPGKGLFYYAPPLLLSLAGLPFFLRRHGRAGFIFVAAPLLYLLVYGSKGVWHGGGWGPRYLVAALPLMAVWSLPVLETLALPKGRRGVTWLRRGAAGLLAAGILVQGLGVAKHPNRYTVMFRDHILPQLPDYGVALGGRRALAYWRHFGGPQADRQLARPAPHAAASEDTTEPAPAHRPGSAGRPDSAAVAAPAPAPGRPLEPSPQDPPRGLGYAFAEDGALALRLDVRREVELTLTVYACDWDHRGRRQRLEVIDAGGRREHTLGADFSGCQYLTWPVAAAPGQPLEIRAASLAGDVPVLSGLFFDPPLSLQSRPTTLPGTAASSRLQPPALGAEPGRDEVTRGDWQGRYGADGQVLFGWRRGGVDVGYLPDYVAAYAGGERVWLDTGEAELADTAMLYVPAFSPLPAHAWLLGNDLLRAVFPGHGALLQRALASPPWRYRAGLELHAPHPEYGLGLDLWQVLLRTHFRSHPRVMAGVWAVTGALLVGLALCATGLARELRGDAPGLSEAPPHRPATVSPRAVEGGA